MITKKELEKEFYNGTEVAELLNVTNGRIRQLCLSGRFDGAFKFGTTWLIPRESVENYERGKPGPRGNEELRKENERLRELLKEFTNNENIGKIKDSAE